MKKHFTYVLLAALISCAFTAISEESVLKSVANDSKMLVASMKEGTLTLKNGSVEQVPVLKKQHKQRPIVTIRPLQVKQKMTEGDV